MSIFSIIRSGRRQQAKEHPEKRVQQKQEEHAKSAYKHVPAHAAVDAPAVTPPSRRTEDSPRTADESRRESAATSAGPNAPNGGIHRVSSSLSNVMYPTAHANPMVATQRYSYNELQQWQSQCCRASIGVVYPVPNPSYIPEVPRIPPLKAKEVKPVFTPGSPREPSRRADKGNGSAANPNSLISSKESLEAKRPERPALVTRMTAPSMIPGMPAGTTPAPKAHHLRSSSATETTHRLHPSRQRRLSDASIEKPISGAPRRGYPSSSPRDSRPPLSMRGFDSIPPVPTLPLPSRPISHSQGIQSYSNMTSPSSSLDSSDSSASSPRTTSYSSRMTPSTSVSPTGSSASYTSVSPSAAGEFVFPFTSESKSASDGESQPCGTVTPSIPARPRREAVKNESPRSGVQAHPPPTTDTDADFLRTGSKAKNYYPPKTTRFTDAMSGADTAPPSRSTRVTSWLTRRFSQSSRASVEAAPTTDRASTTTGGTNKRDGGRNKLTKARPSGLISKMQ